VTLPAVKPTALKVAKPPAPVDGITANCATPPTAAAVLSVTRVPASICAFVDATGILAWETRPTETDADARYRPMRGCTAP
jgi:hypothetical protein